MARSYSLDPLTAEECARWDGLISGCPKRELFHRGPWLNYLRESRGVTIGRWLINEGNVTVGYFCGGLLRKGPFRILGSPLKSWGSNFMGPIPSGELDLRSFLMAVDELAEREQLAMSEMEHRDFTDPVMKEARYEAVPGWTYLVSLAKDPEVMWGALDATCRNRIRKAMRIGLRVEDTADPVVADEFYDQYCNLLHHKGLGPPYPRAYPRALLRHLKPAGMLLALRVSDPDGRILATGLFPHDEHTIYFWGGASWHAGRDLCPNEILHWTAMRTAAELGLSCYDMCGYGRFKRKFGGALVELQRWHKCYWRSAKWARRGYEIYFQKKRRIQGWWRRLNAAERED